MMECSTLEVTIPPNYLPETQWVLDVVLREFLGLTYTLLISKNNTSSMIQVNYQKKTLSVANTLFSQSIETWKTIASLPVLPLRQWDTSELKLNINLTNSLIPIIYGSTGFTLDKMSDGYLSLDIFGSIFFMLSRYEEIIISERDNHDRFPASASLAYKEKFLDRPIVDEYIEILWSILKSMWPNLKRKERKPKVFISCDVDAPYSPAIKDWRIATKQIAGDIIKRKSLKLALYSTLNAIASRLGNYHFESYNTFEWIMDVNEQADNKVTFYFISDHSAGKIDGCYSLQEPRVRELIYSIHERGHIVGLHGSYNTYQDGEQIKKEANNLCDAIKELDIQQDLIDCRQHFLRWKTPDTASHLNSAGFKYDTSLSFADYPGFRCGTSHEYKMYDLNGRVSLEIKQRPLIVMECSILAKRYMGLGYSKEAMEEFLKYKNRCKQFNGNFTLLWHNSHFLNQHDKIFYKELIQ